MVSIEKQRFLTSIVRERLEIKVRTKKVAFVLCTKQRVG
jgi:hypothetical protein